jgi:hypothetical protein
MKEQDYILKKYVRASSASEAIRKDADTPVCEAFLVTDKPSESSVHAVGFTHYPPDEGVPFEARRRK